ncbi:MAG TPA: response regulator [Gammaproteobacteria bacterium]|nr:response regulator [Gammaproteobacteria bacterium]
MSDGEHILVVDDDGGIRRLLADYLGRNGYRVSTAADGAQMQRVLGSAEPDLIVLDIMLPGADGIELCRRIRAGSEVPMIMLTARGEETDRVVGLEIGADDYLAKPFSPRELLARIKSVLRRTRALPPNLRRAPRAACYRFSGWTLDPATRQLTAPDGVLVPLSGAEYLLLIALLEHPGVVLSRDQLLDLTRGRDAAPFDRSIDVQVSRLRQKLREDAREPTIIRTLRSEGYVLATRVDNA